MKAILLKIGQGIAKFWQTMINDWRIMLMIIAGLVLFIVSWLLWANLSSLFLGGQLLMSLLSVLVYALIIGIVYGFRALAKSSAITKLAQKAKGIDRLKPTVAESTVEAEIKQYLKQKLAWKRFIPLALQKLFVRKKIYLAIGKQTQLQDYLAASGWACLDNPENVPLNVWSKDKAILIVAESDSPYLKTLLKLLAQYSMLRRLSGIMQIISITELADQQAVLDTQEKLSLQRKQLHKHFAFKGIMPSVLIANLDSVMGADELMVIPEFKQFFTEHHDLNSVTDLQHLTANITKYTKSNPETVDNAKLYWLLTRLQDIHDHLHTCSSQTLQLLEPCGVANTVQLFNYNLQQAKQNRRGAQLTRLQLGLKSGLFFALIISIVGMVASFSLNYQKITTAIGLAQDYRNLPWTSYQKTDLTPVYKSYQLYSLYNNEHLLTHMGLYQGNKVEDILRPLFIKQVNQRYIPVLDTELQQLLTSSISIKQNVAQALSAYLMLNQPAHFDASYVKEWLSNNKVPLANNESLAVLMALQHETFAASKVNNKLLSKAKQQLPSLSTQIRYQLLKQAGKAKSIDSKSALGDAYSTLANPSKLKISNLYSKASLIAAVQKQPGNVVDTILHNIWFYDSSTSQDTLRQQILDEYVASTINQWHVWINKVQFKNTSSLDDAYRLANHVASSDGPWQTLAKFVLSNTEFADKESPALAKVQQSFAHLNAAVNASSEKQTRQQVRADFNAMAETVRKIDNADNRSQTAFKTITTAMSSGEGIAGFNTLDANIKLLPSGVQHWLLQLRTAVTSGVFAAAHQEIINNLKPVVANQLDNIINQYPFNTDSQNDVDPAQLSKLFAKDGAVSQFVAKNINPFYAVDTQKAKTLYGASIHFSDNEQKFYALLANISNRFFGNDGSALQIAFSMSPTYLSNSVGYARLNLLNNNMVYQHGPQKPINYSWPTSLVNLNASLQFVKANGQKLSLTDRGIWAWLRLIDKAEAEPSAQKNVWKLRYRQGNAQFQLQVVASPAMNVILNGDLANLQLADSIVENNYE